MEKLNILKNVILADSATFDQLRAVAGENVDYSTFELTHGYGQLIKAGAVIQKGVTGTLTVDLKIRSFKETSYKAATDSVRTHMDEKIVEHLDECEKKKNHADWWFWFHSNSESEYEHHKNQNKETITDKDQEKTHALEESFGTDSQEYHVSGTFQVEGQSTIPTTVFLFVEMLTITTSNGQSQHVINSTPIAADGDGDTSAAKVKDGEKLNIVAL